MGSKVQTSGGFLLATLVLTLQENILSPLSDTPLFTVYINEKTHAHGDIQVQGMKKRKVVKFSC